MALGRAAVSRVDIRIQNAVKGHRRRPCRYHRNHNPQEAAPKSGIWKLASRNASKAPVNANGRANTECSNLIISRVSRSLFQKRSIFCTGFPSREDQLSPAPDDSFRGTLPFYEMPLQEARWLIPGRSLNLMDPQRLQQLLEQVQNGGATVAEAVEQLRHLPFEDLASPRWITIVRCGKACRK